jgi:hypothetical protein
MALFAEMMRNLGKATAASSLKSQTQELVQTVAVFKLHTRSAQSLQLPPAHRNRQAATTALRLK